MYPRHSETLLKELLDEFRILYRSEAGRQNHIGSSSLLHGFKITAI